MRFVYEPSSLLPPLAWCAHVDNTGRVRVRYGTDVETRDEGFVEGAWDGDFDQFDFDTAQTLSGTGGRLRDSHVVFAAPFHPLERLFVLRDANSVLVSNSLVFLLSEAGDGLDITYPNYFFDFVAQVRRGIAPPATRLRTRDGRHVELFPVCNIVVGADLSITRLPKPLGPPPDSYADYLRLLVGTATRVAQNAKAAGRARSYRLVAACSRGYDSTATAAIASLAGGREGVTFVTGAQHNGHPLRGLRDEVANDSGADTLRALGMTVAEFDRADVVKVPGHPRAEFYISPASATDAATALMEPVLRGSLFVSGRHGERYWGPTTRCRRRDLREVDDCFLSGHALGEFRLRASLLHFPIAYIGALHAPAIFRITHSAEMRPWSLGTGYYDRPIARRIAEEAGVPREMFGHRKFGATAGSGALGAESEVDFQAFVESQVPESIRRRLDRRPLSERAVEHGRVAYLRTNYAHWPMMDWLLTALGTDRMNLVWNSVQLYRFHWGAARIAGRYT